MAESVESGEIKPVQNPKGKWPLWKKFAIVGLILIVVVPLGVGLGVGLGRRGGGGDDDDDDGSDGSDDSTPSEGNRTSLWQPEVGAAWQIILLKPVEIDDDGSVEPDVGIYDVDLFDNDAETFSRLHKTGKKVICYFSAGSWEEWRDDKGDFDSSDLGNELDGWPGERWINVSSSGVRDVMKKRIKLAADKGCDAIDPDNVDGYQNDNGLDLTSDHAVDFIKFLADEARAYNMSTGLKNAGDIIPDVLDSVHFSVNEQCVEFSECETFAAFVVDGKPVFHIEYPSEAPRVSSTDSGEICSQSGKAEGTGNFSTVIKKMNLDGWVEYCDSKTYTTELLQ